MTASWTNFDPTVLNDNSTITFEDLPVTSTFTHTGNLFGEAPREEELTTMLFKNVRHSNKKYWFTIRVDEDDAVSVMVFKGNWNLRELSRFLPDDFWFTSTRITSWRTVTKRSTLPATIGAAYFKADEAVQKDLKTNDKLAYAKEILALAPEDNLRMISELEKLENPTPAVSQDEEPGYATSASARVGQMTAQQQEVMRSELEKGYQHLYSTIIK